MPAFQIEMANMAQPDGRIPVDALHAATSATEREQLLLSLRSGYAALVFDKLGAIRSTATVFSELNVRYALIGGLAVGIRSGVPRATLDVDFAVATSVQRAWLIANMCDQAFRLIGEFAHSINFVHESGEPVQLAFDAAFDAMIERAEVIHFGDLAIPVVTKDDLIAMKRRAASDPKRRQSKALRDQADIALLEGDVPEPGEGW